MVRAIFSGGARVHWLNYFNSFLAKQLNIACSVNAKLLCPWVPVCSAKTTYVSDSANFVAAKIIAALWFFADNSLLHADCKRNSRNFTQNCAKFLIITLFVLLLGRRYHRLLCFMFVPCYKQKDENAICILIYDLTKSCTQYSTCKERIITN